MFNFPFGKLFLGDAGAYLLGALIPIALIEYTFDNGYSPWFVLAMLIYPVTEVLVSVIRKVFLEKCLHYARWLAFSYACIQENIEEGRVQKNKIKTFYSDFVHLLSKLPIFICCKSFKK